MKIRKVKNLKRERSNSFSRKNYLRLDKNEKVDKFKDILLKKINLNSFDLSAYPEVGQIYNLLSKKLKISEKQILITPGSDFGYRVCFEFFCKKRKNIICLEPTFGMVDVYIKLNSLKKKSVGYDKNLKLKLHQLFRYINNKVAMIILANPNSPTGTIIDIEKIYDIIKKAQKYNIPVIIDEAYYGFYDYSFIKDIGKFNNLIILRTFSKSFGLAGLRAGYVISNETIIKELFKFKPMYEINSIACKILQIFIKHKDLEKSFIKEVLDGKNYFQRELDKLNFEYLETNANFIHINLRNKKKLIEKKLKNKKILTRKGPGVKGFESYLRITLGPRKEMKKVVDILKSYVRA